ncbi:MAG: hypothetical protein JWM86_1357, partial [Thermoleophilia bacterium]|nr:hypothetical protein [Thermoleophilia bacterium]
TAVLVVDDHPANVRVIELILEELDVRVIPAHSGDEALRILLEQDVAVIVLDVRMPGMDGFETAAFVKQRERTRHVPIIFLTAMANDREQALSGYKAGAVDFIEKPVEPLVLRSKVAAFAELHANRLEVERQAELLREAAARDAARELQEVQAQNERRYRDLAEAMPAMVFALAADGTIDYRSPSWEIYTGGVRFESVAKTDSPEWAMVHPTDRAMTQRAWVDAIAAPEAVPNGRLELQVRMRRHDGAWLWHMIRCVPRFDDAGVCVGWVGTATEIDTARRITGSQRALSEVGAVLVNSADIDVALPTVAGMAVDEMVDWCSIDVLDDKGIVHRRALAVDGAVEPEQAEGLSKLLATDGADSPVTRVLHDGSVHRVLVAADGGEIDSDSPTTPAVALCVPLVVRGERIGAIAVAVSGDGRFLGEPERVFARSLATRVASALDSERQFRRAQERAQASEVLDAIADGVVLVDRSDIVRLWNPAAALITGVDPDDVIGRPVTDVLPTWESLAQRVPINVGENDTGRSTVTTVPLSRADGRDVWLSVSAVGFARGVAYAFRDLTEERAVERMKSDFVATVSHELRTPLASIHGAAMTLTRDDIELSQEIHDQLLDVISQQSNQLAEIVNSVLTASRLDSGQLELRAVPVNGAEVAQDVVDAALARSGQEREVLLELDEDVPLVSADRAQLQQVLENLVENALKYSPEGGAVTLRMIDATGSVTFEVEDQGIGIPPAEQRRVFDKFYRVDADMAHGVGGTGLGLFIVRELVRRMAGRIDLRSTPGSGSVFVVTLPAAHVAQAVAPAGG